jgi:hypothetical protein
VNVLSSLSMVTLRPRGLSCSVALIPLKGSAKERYITLHSQTVAPNKMPDFNLRSISKFEKQLDAFISADAEDTGSGNEGKVFLAILKNACALIRGAEAVGATNVDIAIERVDQLINKALNYAYGDSEMYD